MTINKVKSVYSNKNILSAAVFVKIPFALWLMFFQKKAWRILGLVATPIAMLAVFFMSSRAFYLGLFLITAALVVFLLVRYFKTREKPELTNAILVLSFLVVTLGLFSFIESKWYPKPPQPVTPVAAATSGDESPEGTSSGTLKTGPVKVKSSTSVAGRLSTMNESDVSASQRLTAWKRSWHVLKQNPLLGVGLGNWKVATLKEENQTSENFIYQYKAHNDFIEIPAESGIFAGLCFLAIFVFLFRKYIKLFFHNSTQTCLVYLFLPTVGLFAYSFDAFFNFPQDRPEIQSLFALYAGTAIALTSLAFAGKGDHREDDEMAEALALPRTFSQQNVQKK